MAEGLSARGDRKKRGNKWLCGVPKEKCCGGQSVLASSLKGAKSHSSPIEAFKCYRDYLIKEGYKQIGPREFSKDGGPVLVLTKQSKFGARLRGGKGSRFMGDREFHGGTIIS